LNRGAEGVGSLFAIASCNEAKSFREKTPDPIRLAIAKIGHYPALVSFFSAAAGAFAAAAG
jgi:hypothetical protein